MCLLSRLNRVLATVGLFVLVLFITVDPCPWTFSTRDVPALYAVVIWFSFVTFRYLRGGFTYHHHHRRSLVSFFSSSSVPMLSRTTGNIDSAPPGDESMDLSSPTPTPTPTPRRIPFPTWSSGILVYFGFVVLMIPWLMTSLVLWRGRSLYGPDIVVESRPVLYDHTSTGSPPPPTHGLSRCDPTTTDSFFVCHQITFTIILLCTLYDMFCYIWDPTALHMC